jgi:hypothetical protein
MPESPICALILADRLVMEGCAPRFGYLKMAWPF